MLYEQRYLRCVRSVMEDQRTFVTSVVWAEMKKSTCYNVDIILDVNGVVLQTQCECAVGQGPSAHCKHVQCVLFGLTRYCNNGSILSEVTCTQVLQQFHRSKPQKGSPLKASNLNVLRGKPKPLLYDPRPTNKRDPAKNEERLRNMMLNWQGKLKSKWPVLQKYEAANIRALAFDHDYMENTWEDHFLIQEKVSNITKEEAQQIQQTTRGQNSSVQWSSERMKRITSSNFGTVCKITDKRDVKILLRSMLTKSHIVCKPLVHGRKYESVAVEEFEKKANCKTTRCGLFVSQTCPMLAASPDRILDGDILVEVKCPYTARDDIITQHTVPYLSMNNGSLTLKKTHNYYYQVQGQLFCTDRKLCKFIIYTFKDMYIIDIPLDMEFVDEMKTKLVSFYETHFKSAVLNKFSIEFKL